MTLIRTKHRLPSLLNSFFEEDCCNAPKQNYVPATNIKESEKEFLIALAVPGFAKNQFSIEVEKDNLTISSAVEQTESQEKNDYTFKEFNYNGFKRSFTLPDYVEKENISASYNEGILNVTIPKSQKKALLKKIEVK